MFKRVPSARTKADNDMLPIAPTSSPTIGNTLVGCWLIPSLASCRLITPVYTNIINHQ